MVAKVEWHLGELYPRAGFIVTNMTRPAERVVAFYNQRGTAEQHIKGGKHAVTWTRLSRRRIAAHAVRLQLHALACNLANVLRTLALPEDLKHWSQTTLRDRLVKSGLPDGRGDGALCAVPADPRGNRRAASFTAAGPMLIFAGHIGRAGRPQQENCVQIASESACPSHRQRPPTGQTRARRHPGAVNGATTAGTPIRSPLDGGIGRPSGEYRFSRLGYPLQIQPGGPPLQVFHHVDGHDRGLPSSLPPQHHDAVGVGALGVVGNTPAVCRLGEFLPSW